MLKRLISTVARHKSGIALLSGAAAVLYGVERALTTRPSCVPQNSQAAAAPAQSTPAASGFRIYRSKTDLGYAYWVLQGRGNFDSFALFDTWEQAMQEAERRIAVAQRIAPVRQVVAKRPVLTSH